ncbi:MAG: hypothetical protein AB1641_23050 [Thermodesulfobacteriota bacterium]
MRVESVMEVTGTQNWIQSARLAWRNLRTQGPAAPQDLKPLVVPPPPSITASGLRGLSQTQDLDVIQSKGLIVNRYV